MNLESAFATLRLSEAHGGTFDALDEDTQMHIVHMALQNSPPLCKRALSLRLVKTLFARRLTATYDYLKLCHDHMAELSDAIDRPSVLVHRLTAIVIQTRRAPRDALKERYPFSQPLYNAMHLSFYKTLCKTKEEKAASGVTLGELWRQTHLALRVGARWQLRDARFDDADDLEWCIEKLCHVMRYVDMRAERATPRYDEAYLLVSVRDRLSRDTPAVPGKP